MLSVGELIWISCRPLLRLVICVACGFGITKADIFPAVAARGAGQIMLNIALPCLMFSKIVPAFAKDNISALGPLVLVALIYEAMGILLAWIVKQFFWVPHRFRYGILVAGGWGNVGDIPTSVIMSVTGLAPFGGTADQNLAVAYISVFILVFTVTLFPMGAHRWISMDYVGPDVEPEEVQEAMRLKRRAWLHGVPRLLQSVRRGRRVSTADVDMNVEPRRELEKIGDDETVVREIKEKLPVSHRRSLSRHVAFHDDSTTVVQTEFGAISPIYSAAPTELGAPTGIETLCPSRPPSQIHGDISKSEIIVAALPTSHPTPSCSDPQPLSPRRLHAWYIPFLQKMRAFCKTLFTPIAIAIFIAFPIALVPTLKALFVEVSGTHIAPAPDGQPPLAFIIDTASFIGAASVPLGLICLGSALARLHVPRNQWGTLPIGAISCLAVGKMLIMPVFSVFICESFLLKVGVIPEGDKVIRFVCIFFSCLPTATTQVFLTQVYSGTGSAEHLSAFLIPQYFLMFFSMTALTAYAIQLIF